MSQLVDQEIRTLREHFWSARDPEGHAFAPLADAYRRKGELDEAVSLVSDGLARLPEFTPGHLVASRIFRARGDLEEARAALDRLLELDGENVLALLEWAELSRDTGDHEGAATGLRRLLALDPAHLGARSMLDRLEATAPPLAEAEGDGPSASEMDFPSAEVGAEGGQAEAPDATLEAPADQPSEEELVTDEELDVFGFDSDLMEGEAQAGERSSRLGVEPAPPDPSGAENPSELATRTMAELFVRQGLTDRAVEIYQRLAAADPMNDELGRRLAELREGRWAGPDAVPSGPVAADAPEEDGAFELEAAPHLDRESPEASESAEVRSPSTIRDLMDDLLSWRRGAVPISLLSPQSPDELAPEGSRLAIRVAGAVPVEDLAPGAPIRTAPEGSPAALRAAVTEPSTAPAQPSPADEVPQPVEEDDDMAEFRDWLEGLRP